MSSTKKLTTPEWIKRAQEVHGNTYDYSITEYFTSRDKIRMVCRKHGEFWQLPREHVSEGHGCQKCYLEKSRVGDINKRTPDSVINQITEKFGNFYDYRNSLYRGWKSPITISCPYHGEFFSTPNALLSKKRQEACPKCSFEKMGIRKKISTETFIKRSRLVHGDSYDYSISNCTSGEDPVDIICKIHGVFTQCNANAHMRGSGCQKCRFSHGERILYGFFISLGISFQHQYKWEDCRDKKPLPFDFVVFRDGLPAIAIEYDGIQHYEPVSCWGGEENLQDIQRKDEIKTSFCEENNLLLIRISHEEDVQNRLEELRVLITN